MFKKLLFTAAAAAAVSVPLAGAAWAAPDDPNADHVNQGVPDKAGAYVESVFGAEFRDTQTSGKSDTLAPGTAYKQGAKLPGYNTPDGYGVLLNQTYPAELIPPVASLPPFQGRSRGFSRLVVRQSASPQDALASARSRIIRAARIPLAGCGRSSL